MIGALGRISNGPEGLVLRQSVVELAGDGTALGTAVLGLGHRLGSAYTTIKAYSAYTGLGDTTA